MSSETDSLDDWLLSVLACPYDGASLSRQPPEDSLRCPTGHEFPVVRGVPVLLRSDVGSTHPVWWTTPQKISMRRVAELPPLAPGEIDPFVRRYAVHTCGLLYRGMRDPLPRYPVASLDALPPGDGRAFLALVSSYDGGKGDPAARIAEWLGRLSKVTMNLQAAGMPWEPNVLALPEFEEGCEAVLADVLRGRQRTLEPAHQAFVDRLRGLPHLKPLFAA